MTDRQSILPGSIPLFSAVPRPPSHQSSNHAVNSEPVTVREAPGDDEQGEPGRPRLLGRRHARRRFFYGVPEFLRDTEPSDRRATGRLLDQRRITGVSGGSFTALAYGLYGDKLFVDYEQRFLKRDVQGEIISRTFSPANWGKLSGPAWGRSELASELYDEILFNNATFGDLNRGKGPFIMASATDISTGSRFVFNQRVFDIICSDLNAVHLSRAAAASSAVPVVLSPVTINNYGGTCNATTPAWLKPFLDADNPPRPAARAIRSLRAEMAFGDGVHRPYLHLVDGGVSDNVGMRAVLDALEVLEGLHEAGIPSPFHNARRIIVFIVNSLSSPPTKWDESEAPPGTVDILLKAAGTPIDAFSYEAVELLKDTAAHWATLRRIRNGLRTTRTRGHLRCVPMPRSTPSCFVRRAQGQADSSI